MSDKNEESVKRTLRERRFIEAYVGNCGNATEAYLKISPKVTRDSAKELGKRMVAKVGLSIIELLDEMGLTDPVVSQKLIDGLCATRESGKGIHRKERADHTAIAKYLDMVLKLKAMYPADRSKLELTGKDGKPLNQTNTVFILEKSYLDCPFKSTKECPIRDKVLEADEAREMSYKNRGKEGKTNAEK